MELTKAEPSDIPVPAGMTVEFEKHESSLKRIIYKKDGKTVFQIEQPSSYEALKILKPAPPKMKKVWTLQMKFKDIVNTSRDFEHKFEAESAARDLGHEWEHAIEQREIEE